MAFFANVIPPLDDRNILDVGVDIGVVVVGVALVFVLVFVILNILDESDV